ncbi:MAG: serine/threonine protein kinase, partial [Planctomycetota bacterium]
MSHTGRTGSSTVSVVGEHIGRALAAPLCILLVIPLLVLAAGLVIGFNARQTLHATVRELTAERFADRSAAAERQTRTCLDQVDTLFAVMHGHVRRQGADMPLSRWAAGMSDQIQGRAGVAFLGLGTADGRFLGVYRDVASGALRATESRVLGEGRTRQVHHDLDARGVPGPGRADPDSSFDPRQRPWYIAAAERRERIWTDPYLWYSSGRPGFSCAEPVLDADGVLLGVVSIDFDFDVFSDYLGSMDGWGTRSYIYTDRREVVAFPGTAWASLQVRMPEPGVPMLWHLQDPAVDALQARLGGSPPADGRIAAFTVDDDRHLAVLNRLEMDEGIDWTVVTEGSLTPLLAPVRDTLAHSMQVGLVALVVTMILALVFALHLVRTDRRARRAERRALVARDQVERLGTYRLLHRLGEGGMGAVWLGEHSLLARPVAVKLIKTDAQDDPEARDRAIARFQREARALARLTARNTIEIHDFGVSDEGDFFLVMELLDGMDLHDLVDGHGIQAVWRVVHILEQAALSLAEAHDQGLVHRDIKPANIQLCRVADELDVVKVLDFGMVRSIASDQEQRLTLAGTVEGTPEFMAPEQAQDLERVDGRADCYALACVAYVLLAGRPPFQDARVM